MSEIFVDIKAHSSLNFICVSEVSTFIDFATAQKDPPSQGLLSISFALITLTGIGWWCHWAYPPPGNVGKKGGVIGSTHRQRRQERQQRASPSFSSCSCLEPRGTTFQARICNRPVPRHPMDTSTVNRGVLKKTKSKLLMTNGNKSALLNV